MRSRPNAVPALLLLVTLACACDAPSRPGVVVETRVDAVRLEVAPAQADPACAPVSTPVCVTNQTASTRSVGPLTLEGPVAASVEGDLAYAAEVAPGEARCGQVLLQPLGRVEVVAGVRAPVEGRGTVRGLVRVPPCGSGPVAATLDVTSRVEVTRACEVRSVPACVRPVTARAVEVLDARIEGSAAWRIAGGPDLPARATGSEPVCFDLDVATVGRGSHAARLEVDVAGLKVPLERSLLVNDALDYHQVDTFTHLGRLAVDFVFVVDDDPAVDGAALAENLRAWATYAQQEAFDLRAAVTTTDPFYAGRLLVGPGGGPAVLTHDDPLFTDRLVERAALIRGADTPDRGFEAGLAAARLVHRPEAYLSVVFVSPSDDVSPGAVETQTDLYVSLTGYRSRELIMTAAIVGDVAGGCALPGGGEAAPGPRYVGLSRATGGAVESLCDPDWAQAIALNARVAFGRKSRLFLTTAAAPDSIEVRIIDPDGRQRIEPPEHWTYDADSNAVDFNPFYVPGPGDTIEIRYRRDCTASPLP